MRLHRASRTEGKNIVEEYYEVTVEVAYHPYIQWYESDVQGKLTKNGKRAMKRNARNDRLEENRGGGGCECCNNAVFVFYKRINLNEVLNVLSFTDYPLGVVHKIDNLFYIEASCNFFVRFLPVGIKLTCRTCSDPNTLGYSSVIHPLPNPYIS